MFNFHSWESGLCTQQSIQLLPKCFLFRPAVERGRPRIPKEHTTASVMDDEGIVGYLKERCLPVIVLRGLQEQRRKTLAVLFIKCHVYLLNPFHFIVQHHYALSLTG